ncbi:hypothetical protein GCM10009801_78510 [Streptomyces albiaxialis]|uniref:Uncharacterized protein n=1 Tax=Streptomyces albiaxialis TaxID=329523 RepID=A0ABN2X2V8_9ACTN
MEPRDDTAGRLLSPYLSDELVYGDHLVRPHEKNCEQDFHFLGSDGRFALAVNDTQRSHDLVAHV